jgi:hypothetical protein
MVGLPLAGWLGYLLWGLVYNGPLDAATHDIEKKQATTDTAVDALKDDVHYIRDRVDAIYDRLPAKDK